MSAPGAGSDGVAERFARLYATLSEVDEAIVRVRQRRPLLERVCRTLVQRGRLRLVWVGEVDEQGWVVPVASAGAGAVPGFVERIERDVSEGQGPTGAAARERRRVVIADVASDERAMRWHGAALPGEVRSAAAFPLVVEDRCVAVVTAYAAEPGYFDERELMLLDRVAAGLAFALEAMQLDAQRRAAEAQLRTSEERFRVAAETMLDSLTILSPVRDERGEIVDFRFAYVNDAYCALVGIERGQLLGRRTGEVFPGFPGSERFLLYRRVALTREPCRTEAAQSPRAWAGSRLAEHVLDAMIAPIGEELVISARDITERTRDDQELRLRGDLLDFAHDAVIVREPAESRVTFWNREAEAIYGYTHEEAIGRPTHELLATVFPQSREAVNQALAREGRWVGELRHTCKDGRVIAVSSRQGLQRGDDGRPLSIIELNSDITDRKRAEAEIRALNDELEQRVAARTAELEQVNSELELFAYSVSHDLRAPLRAIDGFSTALLEDFGQQLGDSGAHYLARIRAGAVRMGTLIDEILELSRLSRRPFEPVSVDLSALAAEIVEDLHSEEPERHVEVEIQDGLDDQADLALVRSLLQNLLANAHKFTSKTPRASISFGAVEPNGVRVYFVSDNGAGFDMAYAAELFRPFHRLHRETEFPGNGIGLAAVVRAVHRHGGAVWAEGAVNEGATFHFSLAPGAKPPASAATGEGRVPTAGPSTRHAAP